MAAKTATHVGTPMDALLLANFVDCAGWGGGAGANLRRLPKPSAVSPENMRRSAYGKGVCWSRISSCADQWNDALYADIAAAVAAVPLARN